MKLATFGLATALALTKRGAMIHARIGLVVFGALEPKAGALQSMTSAHELAGLNHRLSVVGGVLADDCRELLQQFFQARRT